MRSDRGGRTAAWRTAPAVAWLAAWAATGCSLAPHADVMDFAFPSRGPFGGQVSPGAIAAEGASAGMPPGMPAGGYLVPPPSAALTAPAAAPVAEGDPAGRNRGLLHHFHRRRSDPAEAESGTP